MIPRSLSASSVQGFEACPARWVAEWAKKAPQPSSSAADLGTACHGALEQYVKQDLHLKHEDNYPALVALFDTEYEALFDDQSRHTEGVKMLHNWHARQNWVDRTVLSTEKKDNFPVKANGHEVPFNYIWDRCDLVDGPHNERGETWVEVIDYKSISRPISPSGLKDKIQARCYGLAAQIQFPQADRVWVTFDLLRYEPVGIVFTREENVATYRYLQRVFRRILEMDADEAPEQLNTECHWCVRKIVCGALGQHADVGGVLAMDDPTAIAKLRANMDSQVRGLRAGIDELDTFLLGYAEKEEVLEFDADDLTVAVTVLGPDMIAEYGSFGVTAVDKILKDPRLTDDQKKQLKALIRKEYGEPSIKIIPKNPIDE